jgi:MYXO-CTERM domain-containing protein
VHRDQCHRVTLMTSAIQLKMRATAMMMMKTLTVSMIAAAAAVATSSAAHAALAGTDMSVSVTHAGTFNGLSALNNQTYTYGNTSPYAVPGWGSMTLTSPSLAGFDNAVKIDFTAFNYSAFTGMFATIGTAKFNNLSEGFDLASVKVMVNGLDVTSGVAAAGNGFAASWDTQTIFALNPLTPYVTVAWNSTPTPAPGPMALLGLAGVSAFARRRRA